jgi:hypothetical protein
MVREDFRLRGFKVKGDLRDDEGVANQETRDIRSIDEKADDDRRTKVRLDRASLIAGNLNNFYSGLLNISNKIKGVKNFFTQELGSVSGSANYTSTLIGMLNQYDESINNIAIRIQQMRDNNSTPEEVGLQVAHLKDIEVSFKFNGSEVVLDALNDFGSFDFSPKVDFLEIYETGAKNHPQGSSDVKYVRFMNIMKKLTNSRNTDGINDFIEEMSERSDVASSFISGIKRVTKTKSKQIINLINELNEANKSNSPVNNRERILKTFVSGSVDGITSLRDAAGAAVQGQKSLKEGKLRRKLKDDALKIGLSSIDALSRKKGKDEAINSILSSMLVGLNVTDKICKMMGMISDKKHRYSKEKSPAWISMDDKRRFLEKADRDKVKIEEDFHVDVGVVSSYEDLVQKIESSKDGDNSISKMTKKDARKLLELYVRVFRLKKNNKVNLTDLKVHCLKNKYRGATITPHVRSMIVEHAIQHGSLERWLYAPTSAGTELGKRMISHKPDKKSYMEIYLLKLSEVMSSLEALKIS